MKKTSVLLVTITDECLRYVVRANIDRLLQNKVMNNGLSF